MKSIERMQYKAGIALLVQSMPPSVRARMVDDRQFSDMFGITVSTMIGIANSPKMSVDDLCAAAEDASRTLKPTQIGDDGDLWVSIGAGDCTIQFGGDDGTRHTISNPFLRLLHPNGAVRSLALQKLAETSQLNSANRRLLEDKIGASPLSSRDFLAAGEMIDNTVYAAQKRFVSNLQHIVGGYGIQFNANNLLPISPEYFKSLGVLTPHSVTYDDYVADELAANIRNQFLNDEIEAIQCAILIPFQSSTSLHAAIDSIEVGVLQRFIEEFGTPVGLIPQTNLLSICLTNKILVAEDVVNSLVVAIEASIEADNARLRLVEVIATLCTGRLRLAPELAGTPAYWKRLVAWTHAQYMVDAIERSGLDIEQATQVVAGLNIPGDTVATLIEVFDARSSRDYRAATGSAIAAFALCRLIELAAADGCPTNFRDSITAWLTSTWGEDHLVETLKLLPDATSLTMEDYRPITAVRNLDSLGLINLNDTNDRIVALCREFDIDNQGAEVSKSIQFFRIVSEIYNIPDQCIDHIAVRVQELVDRLLSGDELGHMESLLPGLAALVSQVRHVNLTGNALALLEKVIRHPDRQIPASKYLTIALLLCTGYTTREAGIDAHSDLLFRLAGFVRDKEELRLIHEHTIELELFLPVELWQYARTRAQCQAAL